MRLSTRTEYGVRTMVELAFAYGGGPVPLSHIAEAEGIPLDYLEHLMADLRKKELVKASRGAKGGYSLALSPEHIRVGDIIWALEGPFSPMPCLEEEDNKELCYLGKLKPRCSTRVVWLKLQQAVNQALGSVTLADLSPKPTSEALTKTAIIEVMTRNDN